MRLITRKFLTGSLLAIVAIGLFFGFQSNQSQLENTNQLNWQKLRIGYTIEPPYAFKDKQQRVTGESPVSARQIADLLSIKRIQWVELPFSQLIPALQNRQIDMIASGLFISRERQQQVRFSLPTLKVYPGLLALADKVPQINSDLQKNIDAGLQFVVIDGSVEAAKLAQLKQPVNSLTVTDIPAALESLNHDDSDALLLSLPTLQMLANANKAFRVVELDTEARQRLPADYVAFAFHRDDTELFTAWNQAMQLWLGSDSHIQAIRPFGFDRHDIAVPDIR